MFCYQCEQTSRGTGCTDFAVCGKDERTTLLQDLLVHAAKGIAQYNHRLRARGVQNRASDRFILEALLTTVTNVNFDADSIERIIRRSADVKDNLARAYAEAKPTATNGSEPFRGPATWTPAPTQEGLAAQAELVSVLSVLGHESDEVYAFFSKALTYLAEPAPTVERLLELNLECGKINLEVMALLDRAHTSTYGHPVPTPVRIEARQGKAILVSGHDLKDLEELLKQTAGTGINVYTHGEMLPAHGYPELKKYPHLAGNYGGAWQDQRDEFAAFPGAILMTTNCIQRPADSYQRRIFTSGLVAWPDVTHIADRDFRPLIAEALSSPGFTADGSDKTILVGFGHHAVLGVADQVVEAVKSGAIKRFFLVGGCDGARTGRDYYTELAEKIPADCVILTLACGKYRFNKLEFGTVAGLPRLLDIGQCNDAYSAIQIALVLSKAFNVGVNELPLSLVLSWYEQKAVAILLTLLHLGIRNIRLGPTLPAFVSPNVLKVLVDTFNLMPITNADDDLRAIFSTAA